MRRSYKDDAIFIENFGVADMMLSSSDVPEACHQASGAEGPADRLSDAGKIK
jgi:hypothetical protein